MRSYMQDAFIMAKLADEGRYDEMAKLHQYNMRRPLRSHNASDYYECRDEDSLGYRGDPALELLVGVSQTVEVANLLASLKCETQAGFDTMLSMEWQGHSMSFAKGNMVISELLRMGASGDLGRIDDDRLRRLCSVLQPTHEYADPQRDFTCYMPGMLVQCNHHLLFNEDVQGVVQLHRHLFEARWIAPYNNGNLADPLKDVINGIHILVRVAEPACIHTRWY